MFLWVCRHFKVQHSSLTSNLKAAHLPLRRPPPQRTNHNKPQKPHTHSWETHWICTSATFLALMSQTFTISNKSFPSLIFRLLLPAPSSSSGLRRTSNSLKNIYTLRRFTSAPTDLRPHGDSFKSDKRTPLASQSERGRRLTEQRRRKWTLRGGWLRWFLLILSHVWLLSRENKKLPNKEMTGLYVCRIRPCSWQLLNKVCCWVNLWCFVPFHSVQIQRSCNNTTGYISFYVLFHFFFPCEMCAKPSKKQLY